MEEIQKKPSNRYKRYFIISLIGIGILSSISIIAVSSMISLNNEMQEITEASNYDLYIMQNIHYNVSYDTIEVHCWIKYSISKYLDYRIYSSHFFDRSSYQMAVNSLETFCDSSSIKTIAEMIKTSCSNQNDDEEVINAVLNFVQDKGDFTPCVHYIEEFDDIPKYPVETICEGGGDCEDKSILFVSLLESLGYDTILILIPGHCFTGVYLNSAPTHSRSGSGWHIKLNDKCYYTCETTMWWWRVGDLPSSSQQQSFWVAEVDC